MKRFIRSLGYAMQGLREGMRQRNMQIHTVCILLVLAFSILFQISSMEWMAVLLCIGIVISSELLNTAIEYIVNWISPEHHPKAAKIKDLGAAAVLVSAIVSLLVAAIIFGPRFYKVLTGLLNFG